MASLAQSFRLHEEVKLRSHGSDVVVLRADEYGSYQDVRDFVAAYTEAAAQFDTDSQLIEIDVVNSIHGTHFHTEIESIEHADPERRTAVLIHLHAPKHYFTYSHPNNGFTLEQIISGNAKRMVEELLVHERDGYVTQYFVIADPSDA